MRNRPKFDVSMPNWLLQVLVLGDVVRYTSFNSLLAPVGSPYTTQEAAWKSTTALQLYSSGTTGFPKAVELSHFALIANIIQIRYVALIRILSYDCLRFFRKWSSVIALAPTCPSVNVSFLDEF